MRIAHIVSTYPPYYGGMGNVVFQTADALNNLGHDVTVYTPQYYEDKEVRPKEAEPAAEHAEDVEERVDYAKRLTPSLRYGNAARIPDVRDELDSFDLVHLHYPFFGTAEIIRKWKRDHPDKPLVVTYHMDPRAPGWKGLVFKLYGAYWLPKILGSADRLIGSSFDYISVSDARQSFEKEKNKWVELPFGVNTDRFQPREKSQDLMKLMELDPKVPTLLFVGGMDKAHYFKGVPALLEALLGLRRQGKRPQTIFVGDGELKSEYEAKAAAWGLSDSARFVGHVSDEELPRYYNLADLFILPSINAGEAFGMVLLEAMASGVPVVASDLPGVRTVAEDGGMLVSPGSPRELAEAIDGYFSGDTDSEAWRTRARAAAEEKYSWGIIVEKLEKVYMELVEKSGV